MRLTDSEKQQYKAIFDRLIELMQIGFEMEPARKMLESKPADMTITQWHEAMAEKAQVANVLRVEVKQIYNSLESDRIIEQNLRALTASVLHLVNLSRQDYERHIYQANRLLDQIAEREGWAA